MLNRIGVVAAVASGATMLSLIALPSLASANPSTGCNGIVCGIGGGGGGNGGPVSGVGSGGGNNGGGGGVFVPPPVEPLCVDCVLNHSLVTCECTKGQGSAGDR
ncbi:hypothetical protein SAMN02745225_01718 [Ferrithrix thermotolerans DSM 19514]|uniref:Uncharacterized protein n=1 Tax=Ferrithrix thermotolerans DSM 19514 TaxID=1121881 RepID=A0A1M4WMK7_9ACTN|nr:hypothetical protein [Ferrithrix thermotolerans]SHE82448.1 hypothetical protein SAMN02745225_01718 [Ferrithrix thermotolerans DSM 19514]